ncbi:putative tumor suppressor candidate 4 protein [Phaeoacremonium minimum UCRPA7]|uniref:Putative tumor suppressor candidate 4 protein n=1 Tax=Phaeoacremonium minimum (strain UCR-PA7) TaxID=1286976 RepID=R8BGB7_PHAM7|nr:putative tumor suppressor candidate 4 protein [Phaeoacremonium minimum UCRPA7]EON98351.1 putative tumor suppressor candidate 4 protein [Phaeoacremonium minimum UCRPA7]
MIQGIFYARFLPQEGTRIVAQSPPGCIVPVDGVDKPCLFDFNVLQEYIIPRKAFYNRYITVNDPEDKYTVLGFPVSIPHHKYQRNEFLFNFGLVVESDVDQIPYERVVRRLAVTFAEMEKQNEYLSQDQRNMNNEARRPIESLLEIIKEDLNNYGECMIPVDDANTINMKLFPHHKTPPEVKGWHVPVAKMKFSEVVDPTWDLTMQKVIAQIDGVTDVRRIAHQADMSLELTQIALRHLLYYDTILLLDMFFFGACYAPRPGIRDFVTNANGIVDECANYVCIHSGQRVSNYQLIKLMMSFCVGRTVMEWLKGHMDSGFEVLRYVDVRRLVQFGVIKGLLYRVQKYVVSKQYLAALATGQALPKAGGDPLQKYTDGLHNFDQIITEQNLTDAEIMEKLKNFPGPTGDLTVFYS